MLDDPGEFYRLFHNRRVELARRFLGTNDGMALDVGCGFGFLKLLGFSNLIGIDVRKSPAVTVRASAENLPFRDRVFDLVFGGEVLEHLHRPSQALNEWVRVLQPGGRLGLSTPNGYRVGLKGNHPEHKHVFSEDDLKSALSSRGLHHIVAKSIFVGFVSGRRLFRFLPWNGLKIFLLQLPFPSALSYDLFLIGVRTTDVLR